jgi:predicted nuclease with TOPRIM domain
MGDYLNSGIFVYGQQVNNFMNLQKSYIWTVATAALQEVDRQLQSEKLKNIELFNKVDVLINSNSLQDANNQMQSQVDSLTQELTVEKDKNTVLENKVQNIEKQFEELQAKHDDFETKMDLKLKVYVDLINNVLTTK